MRTRLIIALTLALAVMLALPTPSSAAKLKRTLTGLQKSSPGQATSTPKDPKAPKPYATVIKDKVKIEGLFTFYRDTADNSVLMSVTPEQLDKIYLCGETVSKSSGVFSDNGRMYSTFPFYLTRNGENVLFMEKNLRLRADSSSTLRRAVESGIADALLAAAPIKSQPEDSTGAIIIDPAEFFITDATNLSYFGGKLAKTGFAFDKKNSYVENIDGFPFNSEIDVRLHYQGSQPLNATTMQNPYSVFQTIRYSFTALPESDYRPRFGDERMGNFMTVYQDYSSPATETPYVRYVERWHLKKKDPAAELSEPVVPIVYWVENTVPEEYRQWVAEGIEFWNPAFEKIGFKNAVVAKQMPDTASWDPADIRYSTVRWIVPGSGPAVGPSRANPFTGEIFDADVRIPADFIRHMFNTAGQYVRPLAFDGTEPESSDPTDLLEQWKHSDGTHNGPVCNYAQESFENASLGFAMIESLPSDFNGRDSLQKEYIRQYIIQLVAHEVGHTLGFRHNFKASTIFGFDQINDPDFTAKFGNLGTVMDYPSVHVAGADMGAQGDFYSTVPGPWDEWVVEYAYADFGDLNPEEELPKLEAIASRAGDPMLAYGTDEDGFGYSTKSPDPMCNLFDLGNDPLAFNEHQIGLTRNLWREAIAKFATDGARYPKLYNVFRRGWTAYRQAAVISTKYIGGLHRYRSRVGDPEANPPFVPVSADQQRRAMAFLRDYIFAADAFDFPADLLNRLQYEQLPDFEWSMYSVPQTDFPIHQSVLSVQQLALSRLYSPAVIGRLLNNTERMQPGDDVYTMFDMFNDTRRAIWGEVVAPNSVNSFRRQLQMAHLGHVIDIYLSPSVLYPTDARTLAANDLDILEKAARGAIQSSRIDEMTRAHFKEVLRQITSTKEARRDYSGLSIKQ
ncbi:zinc-dependent metalloprotease [bacterium]|nr:zinc-dependent metalloprotease [bacterium]